MVADKGAQHRVPLTPAGRCALHWAIDASGSGFPYPAEPVDEEVVGNVDRRGEGVHLVVDGVLDGALLLMEGRLELVEVPVAGWNRQGGGRARRGGGRARQGASVPAASSASMRALKPDLASAMSSVRTSCHDE